MKALLVWMDLSLNDPEVAAYLLREAPRWAYDCMASKGVGGEEQLGRLSALAASVAASEQPVQAGL